MALSTLLTIRPILLVIQSSSRLSVSLQISPESGNLLLKKYRLGFWGLSTTNGDHGTVPTDLAEEETVVLRRRAEAEASAQVLGTARVAWLGYADSGMTGWDQNAHEEAFHAADIDEAEYTCEAINPVGFVTTSARIKIGSTYE